MPKVAKKALKKEIKVAKPEVQKTELKVSMHQVLKGRVVSAGKSAKTAVVLIEGTRTHPLYKKTYKSSKRYLVHDEIGVKEGDLVQVVKVRPISKHKHWQIIKVVGRDIEAMVTEELKLEAASAIAEVMPEEVVEEVKGEAKDGTA